MPKYIRKVYRTVVEERVMDLDSIVIRHSELGEPWRGEVGEGGGILDSFWIRRCGPYSADHSLPWHYGATKGLLRLRRSNNGIRKAVRILSAGLPRKHQHHRRFEARVKGAVQNAKRSPNWIVFPLRPFSPPGYLASSHSMRSTSLYAWAAVPL